MPPPLKLTCLSDENEIEFVRIIKGKIEDSFEYIFTKSKTKLGQSMTFSEKELEKALRREIFKI